MVCAVGSLPALTLDRELLCKFHNLSQVNVRVNSKYCAVSTMRRAKAWSCSTLAIPLGSGLASCCGISSYLLGHSKYPRTRDVKVRNARCQYLATHSQRPGSIHSLLHPPILEKQERHVKPPSYPLLSPQTPLQYLSTTIFQISLPTQASSNTSRQQRNRNQRFKEKAQRKKEKASIQFLLLVREQSFLTTVQRSEINLASRIRPSRLQTPENEIKQKSKPSLPLPNFFLLRQRANKQTDSLAAQPAHGRKGTRSTLTEW